jgi:hypothetical protein
MEDDPWSTTNKIKCTQCGQYNPIENSICNHAENGDLDHIADFYTCSFCGHRGRRLVRLIAKTKDDRKEATYNNVESAFYQTDVS